MGIFVVFVFVAVVVSTAVAANSFYTSPSSGTLFSLDLNVPGPNMSCIGYLDFGGASGLFQQQTVWSVTENGKTRTTIATSTPTFMLSNDTISNGVSATSSLTLLNVTSNLDGATLDCSFPSIGVGAIPGVFTLKIYRPPVLKSVGTVTGLKNGTVTFQIGDTSSPPPYPQDIISFTIAGTGSLGLAQIQYNHPNMTLTGLTEANTGAYILTATNTRLVTNTIIGSSNGSINLIVQFPPVVTTGPSLVATAPGQPATLVCGTNLRSNPPSSILWRNSNGETLTTGGRYAFGNGSDNVYINISSTTTSDNGTWSCVLNNGVFAPLVVNIVLFIVVLPSQPNNVTSNNVSDPTTQLYISWQPPYSLGVPPVSVYMVMATSSLDPNSRKVLVNTTSALFTQLLPGLSYDITVVAMSAIGGVSTPGRASDKVTFSTIPTVPTLMCKDLIATFGGVNVSWTFAYNGGRDITAVQIEYIAVVDNDQQYQPISLSISPNISSVIAREMFVANRSYSFRISANNSVGTSKVITCGPVLIKEGIPIRPDQPIIVSTKPGIIAMTLSVAASGAGATGSFAFIISSVPSIDMMSFTYSFPMYIDQQKVSVFISNINDGIVYTFNVSASNAYGTSQPVAMTWIGTGAADASVAGPVAGGVIGGTILVLLALIIANLILKHRARPIKKVTEVLDLEQNTAYGMIHKQAHPVDQKKVMELQENTAYGVVQKREAVDVKENTAYGMIPQADADSTYDVVQNNQAQKQ